MNKDEQKLLTIDQAAQTLQVSRATLYRLLNDGSVPSVYIRGSRRIAATAIDRYINGLLDQSGVVR